MTKSKDIKLTKPKIKKLRDTKPKPTPEQIAEADRQFKIGVVKNKIAKLERELNANPTQPEFQRWLREAKEELAKL